MSACLDTGAIERHGAYKQLFGIPSEETLTWKDHIQQAVYPDDRERVRQFYQQLIGGTQDKDRLEYRTDPQLESVSWVKSEILVKEESDTGSRHAIGVAQNITTQKERELELQRKERRFHAIFDDPNILVGLVSPEGTLLEINQTAMNYIQASSADVVGESFWKTPWFNHCENLQKEVRAWINRAASGEYVEFEARLKSPENDPYMVEGMFRPVKNDDGGVVSILVTDRDITDRKRYEQEVEQQNKRLTDFAGIVSHDLRNPLQVAQGRLEIVQADITHEQLPVIDKAQRQIQELIDELLLVASQRDITINTKTVDLETTARDCWQNASTAHATLKTDVNEKIRADKTKLKPLLKNFFRNAIEHSGATSRVEVGALEDGFYIADDGPGIPQDQRENVFTLGYSRSNAGTGIGLTVIKEIVAAHDWTITITERSNGGARFEITGVDFENPQ